MAMLKIFVFGCACSALGNECVGNVCADDETASLLQRTERANIGTNDTGVTVTFGAACGESKCRAGDWFKTCPAGKTCGKGGCYDCKSGWHVCPRDKGFHLSSCPNHQQCHKTGCVAGENQEGYISKQEMCCEELVGAAGASCGVSTCRTGDWFKTCPAFKTCGKGGCYNCPNGWHVCPRDRGFHLSSCPNHQQCHKTGCVVGENQEAYISKQEMCCEAGGEGAEAVEEEAVEEESKGKCKDGCYNKKGNIKSDKCGESKCGGCPECASLLQSTEKSEEDAGEEVGKKCKKAKTGTCLFPFRYKGEFYKKCTTAEHDTPWCATSYKVATIDGKEVQGYADEWSECECGGSGGKGGKGR